MSIGLESWKWVLTRVICFDWSALTANQKLTLPGRLGQLMGLETFQAQESGFERFYVFATIFMFFFHNFLTNSFVYKFQQNPQVNLPSTQTAMFSIVAT